MPDLTPRRILFPTDFSTCAEGAFRHAALLADRFDAALTVLHVVEDASAPTRAWPDVAGAGTVRITMEDVCHDLRLPLPTDAPTVDPRAVIEVEEEEIVGRDAAEAILDFATEEEVDLVVMGTHGRRGLERAVVGSVAEAVARRAPCPVLAVRPRALRRGILEAGAATPIVVAVDDPTVDRVPIAARAAARYALAYGLPLTFVHVLPIEDPLGCDGTEDARRHALTGLRALAETLRTRLEAPLQIHTEVRFGEPVASVIALAEATQATLVVVGTHGRRGPGRALLGSVAEAIVRTAPCPVLIVRDRLAAPPSPVLASRASAAA